MVWRVARSEGARAVRERLLDHLAEARRRRGFPRLRSEPDAARLPFPVLDLTAAQPVPWLGGSQLLLGSRLEREGASRPTALLFPDRDGWRLELRRDGLRGHLRLRAPQPSPVDLDLPAQAELVIDAVRRVGARLVHVHGLAGWSPRALAAATRLPSKLAISLHDFAGFCLRPHLLEQPEGRFCGFSRDPARCARCLAESWSLPPGFQERRREAMAELLRSAEALVFPSPYLATAVEELYPGLSARRLVLPPSPSGLPRERRPAPLFPPQHVAFVGSVHPHKGAAVFERLVREWRGPTVRWSAFGNGDRAWLDRLRSVGVEVRGYYRTGSLPELLVRERVDVALALSVVPESYGLVLDECRAAGVPVVAFAHGALAERLVRVGAGRTVTLADGAAGVAAALAAPFAPVPAPEPFDATDAHLGLYRELGIL